MSSDQENNKKDDRYYSSVLIQNDVLTKLLEEIEKVVGFEASHALMRQLGNNIGEKFVSYYGKVEDIKILLRPMFMMNEAAGWVNIKSIDFNPRNKKIEMKCTSIISKYHKTSHKPVCTFLAGFYEKGLSILMGIKMKCVEKTCVACGDDFDTFVITPVK